MQKLALIGGASLPGHHLRSSIPWDHKQKAYQEYLDAKSQEQPTGLGKTLLVGGGLGAGIGGMLGAPLGVEGALGGAVLGAGLGGLTGLAVREGDKSTIHHAQQALKDPESHLVRQVAQYQAEHEAEQERDRRRQAEQNALLIAHIMSQNRRQSVGTPSNSQGASPSSYDDWDRGSPDNDEYKGAAHTASPRAAKVREELRPVLGSLLALYNLYYLGHWTSKGKAFYADHELFQRLYESTQSEFDSVAERLMGLAGPESLVGVFQLAASHKVDGPHASLVSSAITEEEAFQAQLLAAYKALDEAGSLSLGLDDLLMQIASAHETNLYLLKQRVKGKTASAQPRLRPLPVGG